MNKCLSYFRFVSFGLILSACGKEAPDPLIGYSSHADWLAATHSVPVISAGDGLEKSIWNDPSVIYESGTYVMYMTSSVKEPFKPPILPFRATSPDGKKWELNPKTPLLSAEGTRFVSIETPSVVKYKDKHHMYYSGIYPEGSVPSMAIGHATSDDGINWKNDTKPVIEATGKPVEWNGFLVAEPGAIVYQDKIYVYFTAMGARPGGTPPQLQTIGLVTSEDGSQFSKPKQILAQSALYPPEKGFVGYSTPAAVAHENKIYLLYDVAAFVKNARPEWQQVALHYAISADGETDFVESKKPLLLRNSLPWASGEVLAPSVIIKDGKIQVWFAGHVAYSGLPAFFAKAMKGSEFGIGYTEMDFKKFSKIIENQ